MRLPDFVCRAGDNSRVPCRVWTLQAPAGHSGARYAVNYHQLDFEIHGTLFTKPVTASDALLIDLLKERMGLFILKQYLSVCCIPIMFIWRQNSCTVSRLYLQGRLVLLSSLFECPGRRLASGKTRLVLSSGTITITLVTRGNFLFISDSVLFIEVPSIGVSHTFYH